MSRPYYTTQTLVPCRSIGFLVKRCGVLMSQAAERRFAASGLSYTQWTVLMWLSQQEAPRSATELSRDLGHDMGALTRVVDALERRGLVRRTRSARDRRAVELVISPMGRRQTQEGKHLIVELLNGLLEPYTAAEVETLIRLMQRMHQHLQRSVATAEPPAPRARVRRAAPVRGGVTP